MRVVPVMLLLLVASGCSGGGSPEPISSLPPTATRTSTPTTTSSGPSPGAGSAIVGDWERVTTCEERVEALEKAGLGRFAAEHAAGEGWLPGVTSPAQIKDPAKPCAGAVPLKHGHFFTADGMFGSRDAKGDQVDDGTYRTIDENTIVVEKEFGDVTFDYEVLPDGTLLLSPDMPPCAASGCFAAQWAVSVAYPGLPWKHAG
jgi:hypothetical protein